MKLLSAPDYLPLKNNDDTYLSRFISKLTMTSIYFILPLTPPLLNHSYSYIYDRIVSDQEVVGRVAEGRNIQVIKEWWGGGGWGNIRVMKEWRGPDYISFHFLCTNNADWLKILSPKTVSSGNVIHGLCFTVDVDERPTKLMSAELKGGFEII